jgi:hypothetical protein
VLNEDRDVSTYLKMDETENSHELLSEYTSGEDLKIPKKSKLTEGLENNIKNPKI